MSQMTSSAVRDLEGGCKSGWRLDRVSSASAQARSTKHVRICIIVFRM